MTDSFTRSRSSGTFPKYASLTIGPSVDSGPGTNGIAIVVSGDGVNMPRIQTDTSPDFALPRLAAGIRHRVGRFERHHPHSRDRAGAPRCVAKSSAPSSRTVRSTSMSNGVPV